MVKHKLLHLTTALTAAVLRLLMELSKSFAVASVEVVADLAVRVEAVWLLFVFSKRSQKLFFLANGANLSGTRPRCFRLCTRQRFRFGVREPLRRELQPQLRVVRVVLRVAHRPRTVFRHEHEREKTSVCHK